MRILVPALLIAVALHGAENKKKSKPAPAAAAAKPAAAKPAVPELRVPPDAVLIEPGMWRYTDPDGKVWIYRKGPFALVRIPEAKDADAPPEGMKASEDGEVVRFEKPTPFGVARWSKKKDALDVTERAVWERDCAKPAAAAPGAPGTEQKPAAKD